MERRSDGGPFIPFGNVLGTREPDAIQVALLRALERARLDHIAAALKTAAEDRRVLEEALKELEGRVPPARLGRLTGLIGLMAELEVQAQAAAKAVGDAPAILEGGWLAMGVVRDFNGSPARGGEVLFRASGEVASRLLKPVQISEDGQASLVLDAQAVAEIVKDGDADVFISARFEDRTVEDVAPAKVRPDGLHQFDLILPAQRVSARA